MTRTSYSCGKGTPKGGHFYKQRIKRAQTLLRLNRQRRETGLIGGRRQLLRPLPHQIRQYPQLHQLHRAVIELNKDRAQCKLILKHRLMYLRDKRRNLRRLERQAKIYSARMLQYNREAREIYLAAFSKTQAASRANSSKCCNRECNRWECQPHRQASHNSHGCSHQRPLWP